MWLEMSAAFNVLQYEQCLIYKLLNVNVIKAQCLSVVCLSIS